MASSTSFLGDREEISFPGAIVPEQWWSAGSFPGVYKLRWDRLVERAGAGGLSTACVFLVAGSQGRHVRPPRGVDPNADAELLPHRCDKQRCGGGCALETKERCWCHQLYGSKQFWGCEWFEQWRALVRRAHEEGQVIVVFYFEEHLARHGAEGSCWPERDSVEGEVSWDELTSLGFAALKAMTGLGGSQKAEVAWLKRMGYPFMRLDVATTAPRAEPEGARLLVARGNKALEALATEEGQMVAWKVANNLRRAGAMRPGVAFARRLAGRAAEELGAAHRATLIAKLSLAALVQFQGQVAEARRLYDEVIVVYTESLGPGHRETLTAKRNLAALLCDQGQVAEARSIFEEVIAGYTASLGAAHRETLRAKMNLAIVLKEQGQAAEARGLFEEVIARYTASLGAVHSSTLRAKTNLASLLAAEARGLLEEVVAGYTASLGATHRRTLAAKEDLATLLGQQSRAQRADPLRQPGQPRSECGGA